MSEGDCTSPSRNCILLLRVLYNRVASSADGAAAMSSPDSGLGTANLALDRFQVAHARHSTIESFFFFIGMLCPSRRVWLNEGKVSNNCSSCHLNKSKEGRELRVCQYVASMTFKV